MSLDFEINPGRPNIRTNRELAIISLHTEATNYLGSIDSRVRPVEFPVLKLNDRGLMRKYHYHLPEFDVKRLNDFSISFLCRFPHIELVYAFSNYSVASLNIFDYEEDIVAYLSKKLNDIMFKNYLVLPCFKVTPNSKNYDFDKIEHLPPTPEERVKRIVERSLRFSSW